ncbi:MAG: pdxT, partial [Solirubrobacterales bacterium]|nr:pdxT [Solirubrobacterales bacterium]
MVAPLVGVLALQGGVLEHAAHLRASGAEVREVRTPEGLDGLDGLVLPGGESTTMTLGIAREGLGDPFRRFAESGRPLLATCAGLILLDRELVDVLPISCVRIAFGRQIRSFEGDVEVAGVEGGQGTRGELPDHAFGLGERSGGGDDLPQLADAGLGQSGVAEMPPHDRGLPRRGGGERLGHQHGPLALAEVVSCRFSRLGRVAEHAQHVVPELERLAQRQAVLRVRPDDLRSGPRERGPEVQRSLDGVLGCLVPGHRHRALDGLAAHRLLQQVQVLARHQLGAHLVVHGLGTAQ